MNVLNFDTNSAPYPAKKTSSRTSSNCFTLVITRRTTVFAFSVIHCVLIIIIRTADDLIHFGDFHLSRVKRVGGLGNYVNLFNKQTLHYIMTLQVFAVVLCLAVTIKAQNCTALANAGNCSFYTQCVEQKFQCGENRYPLAYGYRYCRKFTDKKSCFTPAVSI